jgi:hypothetical protein
MKAEASGNPLLIDKIKLEKQIKKLRNLKRGAELAKSEKKDRLKSLETLIKDNEKNIINYEKDSKIVKDNVLFIENKHYEKPADLGNAVYDIGANLVNKKIKTTQKLGNIGDIELSISYDIYNDKVRIDFTGNVLSKIEYEFINETPLKIANSINRKIASYEILLENNKTNLKNLKKEQAELLKIKFGSAWPGENKDNEIVSIPGLRGREPKEISLKNLSKIIHARVLEIIEQAFAEIKAYGHEDPRKKLIAGIVLTGGGAELKHIKQLVEYITGMDTRIGYPNEHLAGNSSEEISGSGKRIGKQSARKSQYFCFNRRSTPHTIWCFQCKYGKSVT